MEGLIHQIIVVCVVASEIYLIHSIVKQLRRPEPDKTTLTFTFFASLCVIGITAIFFTETGEKYESIFRAGTALFCLCNMFVLVWVMREIKSIFSD
jgi:hypothetical protein